MILRMLLVLVLVLPALASPPCAFNTRGANFDLRPLRLSASSSYSVRDLDDSATRNYSYAFNICQNVPAPSACSSALAASPAFQIDSVHAGTCFRLGAGADRASFSLLDAADPSAGVLLTYAGGDSCANNVSRQMQIALRCSEKFNTQPSDRVTEAEQCNYQLSFDSVFACPLECGSSNRKLCGGHGVCSWDSDARAARCFCDRGWSGNDCGSVGDENDAESACGAYCVALVFIAILLLAGVAAVAYLGLRIGRLSAAKSQFSALRESIDADDDEDKVGSQTISIGVPPISLLQQQQQLNANNM